jgi:hypothetical protein
MGLIELDDVINSIVEEFRESKLKTYRSLKLLFFLKESKLINNCALSAATLSVTALVSEKLIESKFHCERT